MVRELVKTTIISERIRRPEEVPPSGEDAPPALGIQEEMQFYDPLEVLELVDRLLSGLAYNTSNSALELVVTLTQKTTPEHLQEPLAKLLKRVLSVRSQNFLSRM